MVSCSDYASGSKDWTLHAYTSTRGFLLASFRFHDWSANKLWCGPMGIEHEIRLCFGKVSRSREAMDRAESQIFIDCWMSICITCMSPPKAIVSSANITKGPIRLFKGELYKVIPYGFVVGALTPIVLFTLHRFFPRAKFNLWNSTIFFCTLSTWWGNMTAGTTSSIIGGFVVMYWAYRHHYELWARYNYILAAAFDAGFNLNLLILFLAFGAGSYIKMPHWWGNNKDSIERCFAMPED